MSINVGSSEIDLSNPDKVVMGNSDLINLVENDKAAALELLRSEVGEISLEDLEIDATGKLTINNKGFAELLAQKMENQQVRPALDTNETVCGIGCW